MPCSKPPKSYSEQLHILQGRGLVVPDPTFALHCLEHHNYYRISAYRFPLSIPGQPDAFRPGTSFNQLWDLYDFDRTLRQLVLEASKRVEISVRSRWAYEIGHKYGPQAYENPSIFLKPEDLRTNLIKLDQEIGRSRETFINHFQSVYGQLRPPIWAVCEVMSFGQISRFVAELKLPADRQLIANTYQMDEVTLCSFLHHLSTVRNTAAHHGRLWNRKFVVKFQLPRRKPPTLYSNFDVQPSKSGNERKLYNSLVILVHLVKVIEPASTLPSRLKQHIGTLDVTLLPEMGFPANWLQRPIWL